MTTYSRGQEIKLRKGSVVRSTNPSKKEYTLSRNQKVTVHSYYPPLKGWGDYPAKNAEVHWAGTGGYWCWTDVENIVTDEN
jgi:hypothetical protein